jgi:hypothetical protein
MVDKTREEMLAEVDKEIEPLEAQLKQLDTE